MTPIYHITHVENLPAIFREAMAEQVAGLLREAGQTLGVTVQREWYHNV